MIWTAENTVGREFGHTKVLAPIRRPGQYGWRCVCDICGSEFECTTARIETGSAARFGCGKHEKRREQPMPARQAQANEVVANRRHMLGQTRRYLESDTQLAAAVLEHGSARAAAEAIGVSEIVIARRVYRGPNGPMVAKPHAGGRKKLPTPPIAEIEAAVKARGTRGAAEMLGMSRMSLYRRMAKRKCMATVGAEKFGYCDSVKRKAVAG